MSSISTARHKGFTLVEMLVIVPMAVMIVGGLVTIIIYTTAATLRSQAYSQLQMEVNGALDRIEQDVRVSMKLAETTSGTGATIKLESLATTQNPFSATRGLLKKADCQPVGGDAVAVSDSLIYKTEYTTVGDEFVRRTTYHCPSGASDAYVWQLNHATERLIRGAQSTLSVEKVGSATLKVTLVAKKTVIGQEVAYTAEVQVRSLNIDDVPLGG